MGRRSGPLLADPVRGEFGASLRQTRPGQLAVQTTLSPFMYSISHIVAIPAARQPVIPRAPRKSTQKFGLDARRAEGASLGQVLRTRIRISRVCRNDCLSLVAHTFLILKYTLQPSERLPNTVYCEIRNLPQVATCWWGFNFQATRDAPGNAPPTDVSSTRAPSI